MKQPTPPAKKTIAQGAGSRDSFMGPSKITRNLREVVFFFFFAGVFFSKIHFLRGFLDQLCIFLRRFLLNDIYFWGISCQLYFFEGDFFSFCLMYIIYIYSFFFWGATIDLWICRVSCLL